jgi:UDP-N-acetylglucosamine--N-acetylmuramyl-(pentapeptide) pyrophosphoryl-undecaprenol N-acetylglucosamine transferase
MVVGGALLRRGAQVQLLISPKAVDQEAARSALGMKVETLPAVGLSGRNVLKFVAAFWKSLRAARKLFRAGRPDAVLAMGGFTAAPAVLAGRGCGAATFLHESNAIPGRANRWLSRVVTQAFVGFPVAADRLRRTEVVVTGTPVRDEFQSGNAEACRTALGLEAHRPVLLVTGGSQGASAINELVLRALPVLESALPELQIIHLCGAAHFERVNEAYRSRGKRVLLRPFLTEMELALGAATVVVSRAGGSSLAELAAVQVPAILIPYPFAADDHQRANAKQYVEAGAAVVFEQGAATGQELADQVIRLIQDDALRARMCQALSAWQAPQAAEIIADRMLQWVKTKAQAGNPEPSPLKSAPGESNDCKAGALAAD